MAESGNQNVSFVRGETLRPVAPHVQVQMGEKTRFRNLGDEGVAILQGRLEVLVVNELGARVLEMTRQPTTGDEIATRLADEYDADLDVLQADTTRYLRSLVDVGAVDVVPGSRFNGNAG